jgi:LruC domain-containing protein
MKSAFNPKNEPDPEDDPLPPMSEYFDFNTRADYSLSVNYALEGNPILLELYAEPPVTYNGVERVKRTDLAALYSAYTTSSGSYEARVNLPAGLTSVYLYTEEMGLPEMVRVAVEDGKIAFNNAFTLGTASTRAYSFTGSSPYHISGNLYSLCKWEGLGRLFRSSSSWGNTTYTPINPGYIFTDRMTRIPIWDEAGKTKSTELLSTFNNRLKSILWDGKASKPNNLDNANLVRTIDQTNFYLTKSTSIKLMFLHERAGYSNSFGYYYYKGSGERDVSDLKKYLIFPNVSIVGDDPDTNANAARILQSGFEVELMFFGENGEEAKGTNVFPEGYTIGWFVLPDGYVRKAGAGEKVDELRNLDKIMTSNGGGGHFISVYDVKHRGVVVGVEDGGDTSFEDLLFCLFTDDMDAIIDPKNPGRPSIPVDVPEIVVPDATETVSGTLAFEDIWPSGGDYDMNDVVVEYQRAVTFDKDNLVKLIVDTFSPVHDGASYKNAFAYQMDASQVGSITQMPSVATYEEATRSVVVFPNAKDQIARPAKVFTVERAFEGSARFKKESLKAYNPYIVVHYVPDQQDRVEVHLPKQSGTVWADRSLNSTGNDAYYIDKGGKYPFAIDIPIKDFRVVTEKKPIDSSGEYPDFKAWVESDGLTHTDWYNNYKGQ